MPGTPMDQDKSSLGKLQVEQPQKDADEPVMRELTQTDRLNQKLLVSFLERMKNSKEEYDKYMNKEPVDTDDQNNSDF
ncbi:uncharacterized protein LOC107269141 [Cephus cinctus]|uniref:Uncharacterized protein LOC107269141 n=1 Tax=Cephus cinctus TaxID=211228 RepID=A0AAJ7BZE7_CEPCN|nr:uncharacterized protein LOC107269141 [Cephus cinctus]